MHMPLENSNNKYILNKSASCSATVYFQVTLQMLQAHLL